MRRLTLPQIATELGVSIERARRLLRTKGRWLGAKTAQAPGPGRPTTYDAGVVELLRALLGQPHRQLEPPESDWLSHFLGGGSS